MTHTLTKPSNSGVLPAKLPEGATYKAITAYTGLEDMGICTISAAGGDAEEKLAQITEFAKGL